MGRLPKRPYIAAFFSLALLGAGAWFYFSSPKKAPSKVQEVNGGKPAFPESVASTLGPRTPKAVPYIGCDRQDHRDSSTSSDGAKQIAKAAKKVSVELAANLRSQGTPTEKAVGAYLQMTTTWSDAIEAASAGQADCLENHECEQQARRAAEEAASPIVAEIAKLASTSNRADVYAIGLIACAWAADSTAAPWCAQLSPRQWAQLEPDNAVPWIFVAGEASRRGNMATRDDALFRASLAKTNDLHWSAFGDLPKRTEIQMQPLEVQTAVDLGILGTVIAMSLPPYDTTTKFCAVDAVADVNRRQVCSNLAAVMVDHADDLVSLSLGLKIGERVGWPADRLDKVRNRKDAYFAQAFDQDSTTVESCDGVRELRSIVIDHLQYGEIGSLQRRIAASGADEAALAERFRSQRQRQVEASRVEATVSPATAGASPH